MKTQKTLLLFFLIAFFPVLLFSQPVSEKQARVVAKNFFYEKINIKKSVKYEEIALREKQTYTKNDRIIFRVFEPENQNGFILISANENTVPVLGYSTESNYEINQVLPPNFKSWIDGYVSQIEFVQSLKERTKHPEWNIYSKKPDLKNLKLTKDVSPLLTTTWNQGCGYNSLCPVDASGPCGYVWAGCVATAMAQVMNYHEHPLSGEGSHSYVHYTYGELSADFTNTTYDWASMPDNSGGLAVSELIYHCGVSVNMNYSPSGSGAYSSTAASALKTYFKYSPNVLYTTKYSYTDENWEKLMRAEIDEGRPLYYQGRGTGGHAFNIDGYQGTDYFHLNWGWGGSYNGYFYLNDLTPGSYSFTNTQGAIVGVIDRDLHPGLNCVSPVLLTAGVLYSGTTTTSQNIVNKYGSCYYHSTGKEVVHQITTTFPGRLRATISDLGASDLDVFILSDCNQDSLLAYGDTTAVAENTSPGTYLIVVDGRFAYEGNYSLTVTVPTSDPDLIITDAFVGPNNIEAGQLAFISFNVKNIGNSIAGTNSVKIYYSENNIFDVSDILINQVGVPSLSKDESFEVSQNITIPNGATEGTRYIFFVADANSEVTESDEVYNIEKVLFQVPPPGALDCSASVSLSSGDWYYGNTETNGQANIDTYLWTMPLTGKEVIHSITATYNGTATIYFSEKVPGQLHLPVLSSCNENTILNDFAIWNPEDTLLTDYIQVYAGITYYFIVDGESGISGNYVLKVDMPGACPNPVVRWWGETDICESAGGVGLATGWFYSDFQWYKNDVAISGETWSSLWAAETGSYKVEVTENGCSAFSNPVEVRINPPPAFANISSAGDTTFCEGNSTTLNLSTETGLDVQWMKNGMPIEGETALSYAAAETGTYSAQVTNISCSVISNTKQVTANPVTADVNELARVNSKGLVSWFSCNIGDNTDLSGNGNSFFYSGWDFPEGHSGKWNEAQYYNGQWDNGTTTNSFNNPTEFTLSFWIKTNTNSGGMIIGFGDTQSGLSSVCDRMVYMDDTGKLYFGVWDGVAKTISTTLAYNDNAWHHIAACLSSGGMKLYVNGELKAENTSVTNGANYTGWWKVAYDNIEASYPNVPTSLNYKGVLDEIKIYERALLSKEVLNLYEENNIFTVLPEQNAFCEAGSTNITLYNSENFIEYLLRNNTDNTSVGSAITGNAETISFPVGPLTETKAFNIFATNPDNGCSLMLNDIISISINELPIVNLGDDVNITTNGTATLDAGPGFVSYLWNNGTDLQTLNLSGADLGEGSFEYWVEVSDINTCKNSDTVLVNVTQSSAVKDIYGSRLRVFPNPAKDNLNILFEPPGFSPESIRLTVTNATGQEVVKNLQITDNFALNIKNFKSGIYFIRITSGNFCFFEKIIIQ